MRGRCVAARSSLAQALHPASTLEVGDPPQPAPRHRHSKRKFIGVNGGVGGNGASGTGAPKYHRAGDHRQRRKNFSSPGTAALTGCHFDGTRSSIAIDAQVGDALASPSASSRSTRRNARCFAGRIAGLPLRPFRSTPLIDASRSPSFDPLPSLRGPSSVTDDTSTLNASASIPSRQSDATTVRFRSFVQRTQRGST